VIDAGLEGKKKICNKLFSYLRDSELFKVFTEVPPTLVSLSPPGAAIYSKCGQ
jgi:hypothetical protein